MRRMLVAGLAIAAVAFAGGAFAKPTTSPAPRDDKLVCSPPSNGGSLVRGICVLPRASVGQPYEGFIQTSDNSGGRFSVVAGALPPGLSMPRRYGTAGTIVSGTPSRRGESTFTVHGVDQEGQPLRLTYSIKVAPAPPLRFAFPASCCVRGTVGESYVQNLFSHGGVGPYTASIVAGTIPPGLALATTPPFSISGTPATAGTFPITLRITDGRGAEVTKRGRIAIGPTRGASRSRRGSHEWQEVLFGGFTIGPKSGSVGPWRGCRGQHAIARIGAGAGAEIMSHHSGALGVVLERSV